jgi:hypothetical protein
MARLWPRLWSEAVKEAAMTIDAARWVRIRMHLARTPDFPDGSSLHGYVVVAPIDGQDHIDLPAWRANRKNCTVTRHWGREAEAHGYLVHRPGGQERATWGFDYDALSDEDDEAGYRFGDHAFREGEYVSIRDHDGVMKPFRIVEVERL